LLPLGRFGDDAIDDLMDWLDFQDICRAISYACPTTDTGIGVQNSLMVHFPVRSQLHRANPRAFGAFVAVILIGKREFFISIVIQFCDFPQFVDEMLHDTHWADRTPGTRADCQS